MTDTQRLLDAATGLSRAAGILPLLEDQHLAARILRELANPSDATLEAMARAHYEKWCEDVAHLEPSWEWLRAKEDVRARYVDAMRAALAAFVKAVMG